MTSRQQVSSGAIWEEIYGYSRAIIIGNTIEISGTTATDGDKVLAVGDIGKQTEIILDKLKRVLEENGFDLTHTVRTRCYTTDISKWQEIAKAHSAIFGTIKPAATLVEVSKFIHPDLLVEIELTAIK